MRSSRFAFWGLGREDEASALPNTPRIFLELFDSRRPMPAFGGLYLYAIPGFLKKQILPVELTIILSRARRIPPMRRDSFAGRTAVLHSQCIPLSSIPGDPELTGRLRNV